MKNEGRKEYEISYLLTAPEAEQEVVSVLKQNGAEISMQKPLASIVLAYPIKRNTSAYFGFCHFTADAAAIKPMDDALRLKKGVIRFLVMTPAVKVPAPSIYAAKGDKVEKKPAAPTALSNEALSEKLEEILK